jgi:hypothetical protein
MNIVNDLHANALLCSDADKKKRYEEVMHAQELIPGTSCVLPRNCNRTRQEGHHIIMGPRTDGDYMQWISCNMIYFSNGYVLVNVPHILHSLCLTDKTGFSYSLIVLKNNVISIGVRTMFDMCRCITTGITCITSIWRMPNRVVRHQHCHGSRYQINIVILIVPNLDIHVHVT